MAGLVRYASRLPLVRRVAADIVRSIPGANGTAQAQAIRQWLMDHILFLRDPLGTELLHSPEVVLASIMAQGSASVDCDDVAMLASALCKSIGLRTRFVLAGFGGARAPFRHVWAEAADPRFGIWVDFDITRPAEGLPTAVQRTQTIEV